MKTSIAIVVTLYANMALAADHRAALKDHLAEDVVAVGYLDLASIDTLGLLEWGESLGLVPGEIRGEAVKSAMAMQARLDEAVDAGANHVYWLFRVSDISHGGPTWVVPIAKGGNARAALELIQSSLTADEGERAAAIPEFWEVKGRAVLGANSAEQLEQAKAARPTKPRDLSEAWESLGGGDCGVVVVGDDDSRRVVREMFPPLPEPFGAINGELIADGLAWGGLSMKLPPDLQTQLVIKAQNKETAEVVQQGIAGGLTLAKGMSLAGLAIDQAELASMVGAVATRVEGTQVRIDLDALTSDAERMADLLRPPIRAARLNSQRKRRMISFKAIGLAMHRYADKNQGVFPTQGNYDESGKPLLSWRVQLLPYLDKRSLYNQFHLDEPWDSEHNLKLVYQMPEIYSDPDPALRKINQEGRTTFVVPVGSDAMFGDHEGTSFKQIVDGTSNTIMLVEVVPEKAVAWTKPEDWDVDFGNPWTDVRRSDREWFTAGYADASATNIHESEVDDDKLRALLTKFGGEVVNRP